jgi:phosphomethylpyrimidine synthase
MKITQEVRDFAAKQNSDSYLATENIKRETSAEEAEEAREGMEEMSKVYNETGRELYIGQGDREHD